MLQDVLHTGFTVSDIERSVAWYTEILGLELVHRQRQDNTYTRTLVAMDDAVIESAMLKIPGVDARYSTHVLELVQYVQPQGATVPLATNNIGVPHLAFLVTDIHTRYEKLAGLGVTFRNPPVEITEGTNKGGWVCYCSDCDGITIEFLQPSPARQMELGMTPG